MEELHFYFEKKLLSFLMTSFRENQLKDANLRKEWLDDVIKVQGQNKIFNIYLNTDIQESSEPLEFMKNIGPDIKAEYVIEERAILQINEVVDISQPNDLRKKLEVSARETLKLLLTDGQNAVIGITKTSINQLINPAIDPGSKILIKPPILVKYGIAFLSKDNTQFYGGRSPELVKKRSEIFRKVSNIRRITKKVSSINDSQPKEVNDEIQQKTSLFGIPNMKTTQITRTSMLSSPSSPSPSSFPSPTNEDKNNQKNLKHNESIGPLTIIEQPPSNHNKSKKICHINQFLSSDDSDFDSSESINEVPG